MSRRVVAAVITLALVAGAPALAKEGPSFEARPEATGNPNPHVPLAAILRFEADRPVTSRVAIRDGERAWTLQFPPEANPRDGLPILGLRPGRRHVFTVTIVDDAGRSATHPHSPWFHSPPLPIDSREWPTLDVVKSDPEAMEPGVTLLSVRRRTTERGHRMTEAQRRFTEDWGLILGLDAEGEVVWYYRSDERVAGIDRLQNGNLLFHLGDFRTREVDMLGNLVREFYAEKRPRGPVPGAIPIRGMQTLHHQPHEMPNGDFLAFAANARTIENYYTSETDPDAPRKTQKVIGDTVVQFNQQGEILWSWDTFEHLDVFRIGYDLLDPYWYPRGFPGHLDWTHGNGIDYDERDDSIIFYLKHQDAAIKVDRATKRIKWIFGDPSGWPERLQDRVLKPIGDFKWPYHAHNPRLTHAGTLVLYENGQWGARPFTGQRPLTPNEAFSRGAEYEIDEKAMTVREVWTSHREKSPDTCHANGMGDAHRLPKTDNMLVIDPICFDQETYPLTYDNRDFSMRHPIELYHSPRIREYTRTATPEVLWEVRFVDPYETLNWQVYGGLRVPSLYPVGRIEATGGVAP